MATAASSTCCQFLTSVWSPRAHSIIFPPISKPTHFQPYLATASLQNSAFSPTPTTSSYSPLSVKAQAATPGERQPMLPPYNVLITGSSKGIGYALAKEFLKAGDNVVICSRSAERVESAVKSLREEYEEQRVWGTQCDVRDAQDVKNLVLFAQKNLGYIDIWINNAGSNAYCYKPLAEASDEDLIEVVSTNTLGLMICCREAIKMMLQQPRGGHIFNIDGAGSDGRPTPSFAAYGATKRSVVHLTKSLQAELQMQDVKNVVVHNLSPGMVTTDLLMSGAVTKQAKFFINVLAEPAEVVAEYLIPNIRSIPANGSWKPTYIRFLTGLKAYSQIFSRLAFGARRNRYMLED
ncbi:chlorophyll(ide) b reductase NOL, chloroplastic [Herrania umbratica]|uniref:chlorophyll(ide) b reductase n=1 Tax=Herrania umbratica TaxID=108875 RepID=A0A6J1BDI7_9ROSI|nr:chlorophyll(ide) b reductase NOL, chloroplastic [Herrania umbratica]